MSTSVNIPLETFDSKRDNDDSKKDKKSKKAKNNTDAEKPKPTVSIKELGDLLKSEPVITKVVLVMCEKYPEVAWLTSKTNVTPEGIISNKDQKLSVQMFGETHIEFDKTVVSIFCILWLLDKNRAAFTDCQGAPIKLKEDSFQKLYDYVMAIFSCDEAISATKSHFKELQVKKRKGEYAGELIEPKDDNEWLARAQEEAIEALAVFTVLNDLGKVESVVQLVRARTAVEEVDHDKILWMGLKTNPKLFPSYEKLGSKYQEWLLEGLGAQFNFAQLVQAESVPGTLGGLKNLSKMALDLFNLHALFDMAGAAGHFKYNGSLVLTEPTYHDMFTTIKCMEEIANGATPNQVYDTYLHERGKSMSLLDSVRPTEKAALRICCNLRFHTEQEAQAVIQAINELPKDVWHNLRRELCISGIDDGWAILLYYAPALLLNCQSALKKGPTPDVRAIKLGMIAMNKCYLEARKHIKDRKGNGVFTADIADIASLAKTPDNIEKPSLIIVVTPVGEDSKLSARFDEERQ